MDLNATLLGQLITFVVLIWFTMKYVWPPITQAIQTRETKIAAGLEAAEQGKRELEQASQSALTIISEAKREAAQIIEHSHKRSTQLVEEAKEDARVEAGRVLEHAKSEIAREVNQAKEILRKQVVTLAVAGAEKIIQRHLDPATQDELLTEFVAQI